MKLYFEDGSKTDYLPGGIIINKLLPLKFKQLFDNNIPMLEEDVRKLTDELNIFISQNAIN